MNSKDFHVCVQTVSMGYSANQVRGNSKDIEGRIYVFNEESTLIEIVIVLDVSWLTRVLEKMLKKIVFIMFPYVICF